MKFGKEIRIESSLEWNTKWIDYYVDYKGLKHMLKKFQNGGNNSIEKIEWVSDIFLPVWSREARMFINHLKRQLGKLVDIDWENIVVDNLLEHSVSQKRLAKFLEINHLALQKIRKKVVKQLKDDGMIQNVFEQQMKPINGLINGFQTEIENFKQKLEACSKEKSLEIPFDESRAEAKLNRVELLDDILVLPELSLDLLQPGTIHRIKVAIQQNELGDNIEVHCIVVKGNFDGPVLGLTSALHGNELNGIPLIFQLVREIDIDSLVGTVVAIPVLNPQGFSRRQREYLDGQDLNRLFPGNPNGNCGQVYVHNVLEKIIKHFNYHVDLHTASFGRINSLYVRADITHPITHQMAILQEPQIIVHNTATDGTLRSASMALDIPSITIEIGDPLIITPNFVSTALLGVERLMSWLNMTPSGSSSSSSVVSKRKTITCIKSSWLYSHHGGMLRVKPHLNTWVKKDQVIAIIQNLFGDIIHTYRAPADAIVVGKSTNPICSTGDRIIHLGYLE